MRKQAEQLVVGRVYADLEEGENTSFLRLEKYDSFGDPMFRYVGGVEYSFPNSEGLFGFYKSIEWYELTPEDEKELNLTPPEPTFTLSDIQRVIERIEREARFISDEDSNYDRHWVKFRDKAIEIMREELKLK